MYFSGAGIGISTKALLIDQPFHFLTFAEWFNSEFGWDIRSTHFRIAGRWFGLE